LIIRYKQSTFKLKNKEMFLNYNKTAIDVYSNFEVNKKTKKISKINNSIFFFFFFLKKIKFI